MFFGKGLEEQGGEGLKNVQWVYLGVAGFDVLLVVLFWVVPMVEVTDADMGLQESQIDGPREVGPFRRQYNLFLAVWSQFCYVGAQVAVAVSFSDRKKGESG